MRRAAATIAALAAGSHAFAPPAAASEVIPVYLPFAAIERGPVEPCGAPVSAAVTCPGGAGWVAVCGGMGRIQDLIALGDAEGTVIAVGDGAARWTFDVTDDAGAAARTWSPQVGQELTGLNAVYLQRDPAGRWEGWAAGDQGQIVRYDGCWSEHPPASRAPDVDLASVRTRYHNAVPIGWAVGRSGRDEAVARELTPSGWVLHDYVGALAPFFTDVAIEALPSAPGEVPRAWAVGARLDAQEGVFVRTDRYNRWTDAQVVTDGWPRELVLGRENRLGRAFGEAWDGSAALGWMLDRTTRRWVADPAFVRPDHALVDAYQVPANEIWVGLSPRPGRDVLERYDWATGVWAPRGGSPYTEAEVNIDGHSAIAAVQTPAGEIAGVVYAWGDRAWWHDVAAGSWTLARNRRRWVDFVPGPEGGALLAATEAGGDVFAARSDGIHPVATFGVDEAPASGAALRALAAGGGALWAVGERGTAVRWRGPMGRAEVFHLPPAGQPRFVDVAVDGVGTAWALSRNDQDGGQVWWFDAGAAEWREQSAGAAGQARWNALAATPGGEVWVVGDGASLRIRPSCTEPGARRDPASAARERSGGGTRPTGCLPDESRCRCDAETGREVCAFPNSPLVDRAVAVAALADGEVWAAGDQGVVRADGPRWCGLPGLVDDKGHNLLRSGARLAHVAVASPRDVWVVARCGREHGDSGQIACGESDPVLSGILRFDGTGWAEATRVNVDIHDVDVVAGPAGRTVWLAGDWSTLIRHDYVPAEAP